MGCDGGEAGEVITGAVRVSCADLNDDSLCCGENAKHMAWDETISTWLGCCKWNHDTNECSANEACVAFNADTFAETSTHNYSEACDSQRWVCQTNTAEDVCTAELRAAKAGSTRGKRFLSWRSFRAVPRDFKVWGMSKSCSVLCGWSA